MTATAKAVSPISKRLNTSQSSHEQYSNNATNINTTTNAKANKGLNLKGPGFYEALASKLKTPNDYQPIKKVVSEKKPYFTSNDNPFNKQCKWLSSKADILGETYQLIALNSDNPL